MSKEQLIASELLSRAEITLSNVLASNDMERDNFNIPYEDVITTMQLATELIIQAQTALTGIRRDIDFSLAELH